MLRRHTLRIVTLATLGLSTALSGCSTTSDANSSQTTGKAKEQTVTATLVAHNWEMVSAVDGKNQRLNALFPSADRPFMLSFSADRMNIQGGCNLRGGVFQVNADMQLSAGPMISSMMACEPALMKADNALAAVFSQLVVIRVDSGTPARLLLTTPKHETLEFSGTRTYESLYGAPSRVFLEVGPQTVACHHPLIANARCLQVRERHFDEQGLRVGTPGEWQMFYDPIEGFTHQEGVRTVLRVNRFNRPAPPADASSRLYVLDMVVESEMVKP